MAALRVLVLALASTLATGMVIVKRELPLHAGVAYGHDFNGVEDFGHVASIKLPLPPAYSTISYVRSHRSKPVSYSGFTNHGRGHHDPGYAIEFRSEGFHGLHHHQPHHF